MELMVILPLLCAGLRTGGQGWWPWSPSSRPSEDKLFEKVIERKKGRLGLAHLLRPPFGASITAAQVMRFLRSKSLDEGGYAVIDEAVRREALLEKAREAYRLPKQRTNEPMARGSGGFGKGVSQNNETRGDPLPGEQVELVYHSLKARLRLALAFGKATAAQRMAAPETASYSSQAMESAIDSMRDAARELEFVEKPVSPRAGRVTSAQLWEFHCRLLHVWEQSKKQDDIGLIGDLDLGESWETILKPACRRR